MHETVSGKALDRAMEIARRQLSHTPESLAYIKRLVRNATEMPLAQDWRSNEPFFDILYLRSWARADAIL